VKRNGRGLDGANPDRQVTDPVFLPQQNDRLIGRQLHPHSDDTQRMHGHDATRSFQVRGALATSSHDIAQPDLDERGMQPH
jgi:hypothetical protein